MRTIAQRLARLEKAARPPAGPAPAPALPQPGEVAALAPQLAQSLRAAVESYQEHFGLTPEAAAAKATAACAGAENATRRVPPDMVSWGDLATLCRGDPAAALEKWTQVREHAGEELRSGLRAADAVNPHSESPQWLARFLALRDELAAGGQPGTGCERLLIDQAAQFHTHLMYWQEELIARTALANLGNRRAGTEQPRLDDAEAIKQATDMVERFNAMFVRTVKALQDTRRGRPVVVVGRASQVNVGQQQVNLNAAKG